MFKYTVNQIVKAVEGDLIKGKGNKLLKGVSTDTRKLKDEELFVALKGEKFDAHDFIDNDLKKRVKAVIVEKNIDVDFDIIIRVKDTTKALQKMAKFHRANFKNMKVIGITGSSGKTSTKDILYNILRKKYEVKKNKGNLNNHIGVPLTLFRIDGKEDFFIVEMGMSSKGEINLLAEIAKPQIGIVTNVSRAHLEFFNSVKEIAKAKGELIEALNNDGLAVLNYDNKYTDILKKQAEKDIRYIYFGFQKGADYYIKSFHYRDDGIDFELATKNNVYRLKTNLFGEHNLYNIAAAVACARQVGVKWSLIKEVLKNIKLTNLRSEIKDFKGIKFINDCYNANPQSMKNAIKMLKEIKGNKKIAVLGDMLELGKVKREAHKEIGAYLVEKNIDYLLTTGKLGRYIIEGAHEKGMDRSKARYFDDKLKISTYLKKISDKNDIVLIKGSRGIKMEDIYQEFIKDNKG